MKRFLILSAIATILLSNSDCGKKETTATFRGKLEVTGICMNYTLSVQEGDMDPKLVVQDWTDETSGKSYENVFRLGNPCYFPSTIRQGDEFYFVIDSTQKNDCAVCMAYYPTPPLALEIRVVEK